MPFRIASQFDQHYSCHTCERDQLDRDSDINVNAWKCHTCRQPVYIYMTDRAGNSELVERCLSRQLVAGDLLVFQLRATLVVREVKASMLSTGKEHGWYVAVEKERAVVVDPNCYVNRIP